MSGCSAVGCSNRGDRGYFMKSFPRNPERRALWAAQMNRDDWQPNNNCRLCEVHFDDDQWEKTRQDGTRRLKSNAVPTLFQYTEKIVGKKDSKPRFIVPLTLAKIKEKFYEKPEKELSSFKHSNEENIPHNILSGFESGSETPKKSAADYDRRSKKFPLNDVRQEDTRCRLCASKNGKNYTQIFGESDLAEKISRCLPIIVLHDDKLPLHVCQRCLDDLNVSYKLIIGSLKADAIFRSEFTVTPKSGESISDSVTKEEPVFKINGPIQCDLCDYYFRDMTEFDTHIETKHLLGWRCSLCDRSFETTEELVAHKTLNHFGQITICKDCEDCKSDDELDGEVPDIGESDGEKEILMNDGKEDEETETEQENLRCSKSGISFDKHHLMHSPRHLKCSLCRKRCSSIFEYLTHKRTAHNQTSRKSTSIVRNTVHGCKYCKKVFIRKQHLLVHLRKHNKEMMDDPSVTVYKCVTCPKKFVDRALYQKHRNVHDPACWHKYRCYICDKSFMDKFKLRIHRSIHDGVKPYQCDICGQTFNRNANMVRHRSKHFEQTCRHCKEVLADTTLLREHLKDIHGDTLTPRNNSRRTNNGVKKIGRRSRDNGDKYVCRYCGKQLTSNCSLLDHERIHTGDKPYVCQHCGKAFRSITARWDHMVRHEKGNYICELCGKMLSNRLNLTSHLRRHAAIDERKFECKECGRLFHVAWKLNAHLVRIHHINSGDIRSKESPAEEQKKD